MQLQSIAFSCGTFRRLDGYRSAVMSIARANRRFNFHKRCQLFIRVHNETLSVAAMRVCNPERSPVGIHG